eukprot:42958-Rhodomonas_salina.2
MLRLAGAAGREVDFLAEHEDPKLGTACLLNAMGAEDRRKHDACEERIRKERRVSAVRHGGAIEADAIFASSALDCQKTEEAVYYVESTMNVRTE